MKKKQKITSKEKELAIEDSLKNSLVEKEKNNQVIYLNNLSIDIWINDKPIKIFLILVIHWPSTFIVGYSFNWNESTEKNILYALTKAQENIKKYHLEGFLSQIIANFISNTLDAISSDSRATFKFNQITKCINRWIKHEFIIIYGDEFKNWTEFEACLKEYINWKNTKDIRLKTGTTSLESIKKAVIN